jgi:hypothetical protein
LGGWAITPIHYGIFGEQWKAMLQTIKLADGSLCPAFHASAMMRQKPPFGGWAEEAAHEDFLRSAFDKATGVIERAGHFAMTPVGVAAETLATFRGVQRDSIWLILFANFFRMLFETHPGARSIEFVFDEKHSIADHAQTLHETVFDMLADTVPGKFLEGVTFLPDEKAAPVQAADFLMYEWRRRITDARCFPGKPERPWFPRMRAARPNGALWRFGREVFAEALKADDQSATWTRAVLYGEPSHRD